MEDIHEYKIDDENETKVSSTCDINNLDKMTVNGINSPDSVSSSLKTDNNEIITKSVPDVLTKRPDSLLLLKPIPSLKSAEEVVEDSSSQSSSSDHFQNDELTVHSDFVGACALIESPLRGTVIKEGDMVLFVADNLQEKIKMSSPNNKKGDTPSLPSSRGSPTLYRQALTPKIPPIDPGCLRDLEQQAVQVATSLHTVLSNLTSSLHNMSSLTVDCIKTYRDSVDTTCDTMDISIKMMYQLMAKCEELGNTMKPVYQALEQIKDIKRLLDLLEDLII